MFGTASVMTCKFFTFSDFSEQIRPLVSKFALVVMYVVDAFMCKGPLYYTVNCHRYKPLKSDFTSKLNNNFTTEMRRHKSHNTRP